MPRCVFRVTLRGTTIPHVSLHPITDAWGDWCSEQDIDPSYVEEAEVTQNDDGSLVAYFRRYELIDGEPEEGYGRIKFYPKDHPHTGRYIRTYLTHHPVTSIQTLLDATGPAPKLVEV